MRRENSQLNLYRVRPPSACDNMAQQTDGIAAGQANSRGEPGEQWKEPRIVGYRIKR